MKQQLNRITLNQLGKGLLTFSILLPIILRIITIGFLVFISEIVLNIQANILKLAFLFGTTISLYLLYHFTMTQDNSGNQIHEQYSKSHSTMKEAEYKKHIEETTNKELQKLYQSPQFKRWMEQKQNQGPELSINFTIN